MHNPNPLRGAAARESRATDTESPGPVPAAANSAAAPRSDSPAEAEGRRTLSTAFVMVGPDGHLTVELRDGRVLVLRDVVMRPRDYCGVQVLGTGGKKYCGGYGDVAASRPGGGPNPGAPDPATLDPAGPARDPSTGG